jgi:hypothetical protein
LRAFLRGDGSDWDWAGGVIVGDALHDIRNDLRLTRRMVAAVTKNKRLAKDE